jgi:hypothetical protein
MDLLWSAPKVRPRQIPAVSKQSNVTFFEPHPRSPPRLTFRTDGMVCYPAALWYGFVVVGTEGQTATNPDSQQAIECDIL